MIYLFSTKWATDQFIQGFAKKLDHKFFTSKEKSGPNDSIAADRFYRFYWPDWDNKLENYRKWARTPKNFNWPDENGTFN